MDYVTRGVCGQESCRERKYYIDNGLWFCRRGHLQEGRQIEEDPDDFGTQGKTHRVKQDKQGKSKKTARGRQASTLFLQAYQLILWKQCHSLVHEHGFPEQFEGVVRDLWALRLRGFRRKINETAANDEEGESEHEVFSSQASASETDDEDDLGFKVNSRYLEWPRLVDGIATCYIAALLMRFPVCIYDFHRLIVRQDIPYIRALRYVPDDITGKFPPHYYPILNVKKIPKAQKLHLAVRDNAVFYQHKFGIALPPVNAPLILYRHIKRFAVPIDVYEITRTLRGLLGFTFKYPDYFPDRRQRIEWLHLPEVQLVVLIVLATKLLFPFDDLERHPGTAMEPAAQGMDWKKWIQAQRHYNSETQPGGKLSKEKIIRLNESDALKMEPHELDGYMDWYQQHWLANDSSTHPTADMFPISRPKTKDSSGAPSDSLPFNKNVDEDKALDDLVQRMTKSIIAISPVPREEGKKPPRPGTWYQRYRWEASLPEIPRFFYNLGAEIASLSLPVLVRAVTVAEWRISDWQNDQRRTDYFENGYESNDEEEDEEENYWDIGDDLDNMDQLHGQLSSLHVEGL